jgi:hypothetical protein
MCEGGAVAATPVVVVVVVAAAAAATVFNGRQASSFVEPPAAAFGAAEGRSGRTACCSCLLLDCTESDVTFLRRWRPAAEPCVGLHLLLPAVATMLAPSAWRTARMIPRQQEQQQQCQGSSSVMFFKLTAARL